MKLTPIGTLADSESGVDYYRLSDLFNTDEFVIPALAQVLHLTTRLDDIYNDNRRNYLCSRFKLPRPEVVRAELESFLAAEHDIRAHDCCGHRFYSAPELLPDFLRDEFIIAHSWGINV